MLIEKNAKVYTVRDCENYWNVKTETCGLTVEYKVDKGLCQTEAELQEYIKNNDLF